MNDRERMEAFEAILEELNDMQDCVLLIEGNKDRRALDNLDITLDSIEVQREGGPLRAAERLSEMGRRGVILTDWDTRGNRIADDLAHHLSSLCVPYDSSIRLRLRDICIKDIKDVESLDSFYRRLSALSGLSGPECTGKMV